jgi:hypothetical protein
MKGSGHNSTPGPNRAGRRRCTCTSDVRPTTPLRCRPAIAPSNRGSAQEARCRLLPDWPDHHHGAGPRQRCDAAAPGHHKMVPLNCQRICHLPRTAESVADCSRETSKLNGGLSNMSNVTRETTEEIDKVHEVEGEIREFVRRDITSLRGMRRPTATSSPTISARCCNGLPARRCKRSTGWSPSFRACVRL